MMRQNKNLMDINIDALYNILKQNQGDVNDAMGSKKKIVVVTSDPLALIAEKTNVSRSKEKVVVSSDSEGSEADDFKKMSRDVLTVGSTMRIPLLYRGEYSQWVKRFMNYLEEQTDREAIINSIKNGDQPLPRVTQVSIAGTTLTEQPPLKDKSMCNKTAKDLWDALARHMLGSKYGEQDKKAAVLYEYETFKANEGELLLDTYIRYLQVINDLKKFGYSKDNYVNDAIGSKKKTVVVTSDPLALIAEKTNVSRSKEKVVLSSNSEGSEADDFSELKKIIALLAKAFNRRKFYSKPTNNNLRTSSTSQSANKKQEFVKNDNKKVKKKDDEKKRDMCSVKCYNCKKEGHFAKDCKKAKVKDYEYYKTKMLLAKKDKDEQVLLAEDQAWMESSSDSGQEINENMVFMAQIEKVLSDSEASSSSADEKISEVSYYLSESESKSEFETLEYYDNSTNCSLFVNTDDDQEIFHDAIESASETFIENHIDSQKDYDKSDIADQQVLYAKINVQLVKLDKHVRDLKNTVLEKYFKISELEECVRNKDLEIEKCLERLNVCENKLHKMGQTNQTVHMIMPSKDNLYNGRKRIGFENPRYSEKAKELRPTLYDEKVIGLGYTLKFLTNSDEALEIEKFKRSRENKIEFAYDYGNLNASYVNEKINLKDDYFQEIINPGFDKIDSSFQQTSSLKPYVLNVILEKIISDLEDEVVNLLEKEKENLETIKSLKSKECDKEENTKVIAPRMFKLNVSQCVSPISMSKSSCDSNNVEIKLKRKRRKKKSSKQNVKQVDNDVSRANNDFVYFSYLDTFSSVRRPKNSGVIWKKKGSPNTSNVGLSAVSVSNLNKNVKRYSRQDLLACNNSHLRETSSASICNDAMNASCNSRMNDLLNDNNFFIFDDVNVRISPVSKMHFRKNPRDSMNVRSINTMNKSLPTTVHKWLPKFQPLAEPVAKWFPRVKHQIDKISKTPNSPGPIYKWIIDSGCSKHMTGNRAMLTNFVEKFLRTARFGNNDFAKSENQSQPLDMIFVAQTTNLTFHLVEIWLAREMNRLCGEVANVFQERAYFLEELDTFAGRVVPEKTDEFLKEIQGKDKEKMLQIFGR
nr:hypothetical protein [Tanacetum cinerariifolium]